MTKHPENTIELLKQPFKMVATKCHLIIKDGIKWTKTNENTSFILIMLTILLGAYFIGVPVFYFLLGVAVTALLVKESYD